MKRLFSMLLAIVISFSVFTTCSTVYAKDKSTVEDALLQLETKAGYIPGQSSSIQYNCFAFISDVCEQLYGISFYYEAQDGNYKFKHSENYFTVSDISFPYTSDDNQRISYAVKLKNWLVENAEVGDVLQYGSADPNYSKKHTVIVQHIDKEKLQVLHANYETPDTPASACRVDTIYWSSFTSNPTANKSDGSKISSLNLLLGSGFKLTQGYGLSLNRYSFVTKKYQTNSSTTCKISKTERTSTTSIKVSWNNISGAQYYQLKYKTANAFTWSKINSKLTSNSYNVTGLTTGTIYLFKVRAYINGSWQDYSTEVSKQALPPKPVNVSATPSSSGINISWVGRNDISGCYVYRSGEKDGQYSIVADIQDCNTTNYFDSAVAVNKTYYYKVVRYCYNGAVIGSEPSPVISATVSLQKPELIKAWSKSKSSLGIRWKAVENATSYTVYYSIKGSSQVQSIETTNNSCKISKLLVGAKYRISIVANCPLGSSQSLVISSFLAKPKSPTVTLSSEAGKSKLTWKKNEKVSGYLIYRSTSKKSGYKLVKTVGSKAGSFKDSTVKSKTTYYYKVKSFVRRDGKIIKSDPSKIKTITIK